jgi:maltooligosyltrehalose trehalohydrolase
MPDAYVHRMPFGAEVLPGGQVRFRLWAPSQEAVALVLEDEQRVLPMDPLEDGFFGLTTDAARVGSRYRYQLHDGSRVPDPASRYQPADVEGPSMIVDPAAYVWRHVGWPGRPWEETVLYELHIGAFSDEGTFDGVRRRLDYLVDLGITAIELMPLSDFAGRRNWGYDGVMPFAPDAAYGTPDELKRLIDEAHGRGLMMFLDVVYNHFGPVGNYLPRYAESFFEPEEHTPWGAAINYKVRVVRDFAVHNVLYWLDEFRFDGLRFDAVDRIIDRGEEHILKEIAATIRRTVPPERHVHLALENDKNQAHLLERDPGGRPIYYDAQWNDDIHHVYHHLLTGEAGGYYADYATDAHERLGRALTSGYVYQGDASEYRGGEMRGEPSGHLPPTAFVAFIQNHDQIGNRAFGERIADLAEHGAIKAMQAVLLLAPNIPLLFMGEEWGAVQPFCFFTDFHDELADAVREGRRREFQKFPEFRSEAAREQIPDPNALSTFEASRLDWSVPEQPDHAAWLDLVRTLLQIRHESIAPRLHGMDGNAGSAESLSDAALRVAWELGDGSTLTLIVNLGDQTSEVTLEGKPEGDVLFATHSDLLADLASGRLPPWSVLWLLHQPSR